MIAHLEDRRVIRLSGEDVRGFLNGLVTNDVSRLSADEPVWAALLSAQGKYLADMILFDGHEAGIFIDVHKDHAADLERRLKVYRLRRKIAIEPQELHVFAGWNENDMPHAADPRHAELGHRWIGFIATVDADLDDWHTHRIALGIPDSPDFEVDKLMWLEANASELNGVSFTKGCYVGQENTARMNYRGKVRKRLLPVTMVAGPAASREVLADGRTAGNLMSQAEMKDGSWRGIAHLRLEDAAKPLTIDGADAEVDWPSWLPED
jgi:folate-binding protein YgfZ